MHWELQGKPVELRNLVQAEALRLIGRKRRGEIGRERKGVCVRERERKREWTTEGNRFNEKRGLQSKDKGN